jgi:hypothetical protein
MGQHQYAQNYDANMAAYGYNGAVPGFSAASLASGAPPLPIYQGWNQDPAPLPPYTAPQGVVQHTGYAPHPYHNYAQHYPSVPQHNYQQNMPHAKPYDEGEVSEGEYEQEYVAQPPPIDYSINQYGVNGGNGYMDTAHRAVYARGQDPAPVQPVHSGMKFFPSSCWLALTAVQVSSITTLKKPLKLDVKNQARILHMLLPPETKFVMSTLLPHTIRK